MKDRKVAEAEHRLLRQAPATEEAHPWPGKKDKKKWCRGKKGIEHTPICSVKQTWLTFPDGKLRKWYVLQCTTCGKHLDNYFPPLSDRWPDKKPDWLVEV